MKFRIHCLALMILMFASCFCITSFADTITFTLGNHPQPGEENVLFERDQMGMLIMGFTNQSHTEVDFSSTTDVLVATAGGQAKVTAEDGLINDITFTLPGHTFTDAIFNAFKPVDNNDLLVTVTEVGGQMAQFQYGDIHGNNFLTIVDENGPGIQSITIDSVGGFQDLEQVRVSGISGVTPTPEPSSALLFGSGILGLLGYFRRRL